LLSVAGPDIDLPVVQARCCQVQQNGRLLPVQPGGRRRSRCSLRSTGGPAPACARWRPGRPATDPGGGGLAA